MGYCKWIAAGRYWPADSFMEAAFINRNRPIRKVTIRTAIPRLTLPVSWLVIPMRVVPRNDAPLPQMSRMPKYSPDFSAGMIFAK